MSPVSTVPAFLSTPTMCTLCCSVSVGVGGGGGGAGAALVVLQIGLIGL